MLGTAPVPGPCLLMGPLCPTPEQPAWHSRWWPTVLGGRGLAQPLAWHLAVAGDSPARQGLCGGRRRLMAMLLALPPSRCALRQAMSCPVQLDKLP